MRVAVIGAGNIGSKHLGILAEEPDVEIAAIVSSTLDRARAATEKWGGNPYSNCEDLLKHERIDVAWICVPPYAHGQMELNLIEQGIPFFVEKPLSADLGTAEKIAAALERTPVISAVGYHWRAMDTLPEVRQTLVSNPARMLLGAWHDTTPRPEWWRHQAASGGQVVEQATHLFDLARYLVGEASVIAATTAQYGQTAYPDADVDDVSASLLRFYNGATGVVTATCLLGGLAAQYIQIVCEGLLISITQKGVTYDTDKAHREVTIGNDPFRAEDRAFLEAIREREESLILCNYTDALQTHRLCFSVVAANYRPDHRR